MKILHVYHIYPALFGGVSRVVYDLTKELSRRGHEVAVLTTDAYLTGHVENYNSNEVEVYRINVVFKRLLSHNLVIPKANFSCIKEKVRSYDCVHFHGYRNLHNLMVYKGIKELGTPYILQAHGALPRTDRQILKYLYDIFFGYPMLKNSSKVIALNKAEAEQYKAMGVPERKITIVPNGIDLSEYRALPPKGLFKRKYGILEGKKIILYLGRIHKTKRIDLLIKAFAYLVKEMNFKDSILVIAGPDDGYLSEAKLLAYRLGVSSSVLFTGFISKIDKISALVDAEVFVTPSFYGFPMTFLEACAIGTPIVTTSLGDVLEWIDKNVGYVTSPAPSNIAKAIYRIFKDERLHERLSRNCREIVRSKFSIEKIVDKLEIIYREISGS